MHRVEIGRRQTVGAGVGRCAGGKDAVWVDHRRATDVDGQQAQVGGAVVDLVDVGQCHGQGCQQASEQRCGEAVVDAPDLGGAATGGQVPTAERGGILETNQRAGGAAKAGRLAAGVGGPIAAGHGRAGIAHRHQSAHGARVAARGADGARGVSACHSTHRLTHQPAGAQIAQTGRCQADRASGIAVGEGGCAGAGATQRADQATGVHVGAGAEAQRAGQAHRTRGVAARHDAHAGRGVRGLELPHQPPQRLVTGVAQPQDVARGKAVPDAAVAVVQANQTTDLALALDSAAGRTVADAVGDRVVAADVIADQTTRVGVAGDVATGTAVGDTTDRSSRGVVVLHEADQTTDVGAAADVTRGATVVDAGQTVVGVDVGVAHQTAGVSPRAGRGHFAAGRAVVDACIHVVADQATHVLRARHVA